MSKQLDNLLFNLVRQRGLVLFHQLGLESTVAIAWCGEFETAGRRFNSLFAEAVFTVCFPHQQRDESQVQRPEQLQLTV